MERPLVLAPRLAAALATVVLLIGACSTSGTSDDAGPTTEEGATSEPADDETATSEADDQTTTTTEETTDEDDDDGDGGDDPSVDDLEALLPTAADIGVGWSDAAPSEDSDGPSFEEQCPAVAEFDVGDDDESDEVTAAYADEETREVEITLSPSADAADDEELAGFVEAVNDCGTITTTDEDGSQTTLDIEATVDESYGDQGVRLVVDVTVSGGPLTQDVTVTIYALLWREGSVGVEITGISGIDTETFEPVPFDPDLLVILADDLEPQVSDLVG